jgi:hypothetical protein
MAANPCFGAHLAIASGSSIGCAKNGLPIVWNIARQNRDGDFVRMSNGAIAIAPSAKFEIERRPSYKIASKDLT